MERVGYFTVDPDSTPEKLVLNRVVTLKESGVKKAEEGKGRSRKEEQARQLVGSVGALGLAGTMMMSLRRFHFTLMNGGQMKSVH